MMHGRWMRGSLGLTLLASVALAQGAAVPPGPRLATAAWSLSDYTAAPSSTSGACPGQAGASRASPFTGKGGASAADILPVLEAALARMEPSNPAYAQMQAQIELLRKAPQQAPAVAKPAQNEPSVGSSKPVSAKEAVGTLEAALEGTVSSKALQALEASPEAKDARLAEQTAAAAMAQGNALAALALVLRTHRLEPSNPAHLVNLSGMANHYGLWHESLALADAAAALGVRADGPMGIPQQAALLNNRAHALLGLGRATEAEPLLRQALTLAPLLAEARTNLALALGKQNKCQEAQRFLRAGHWRTPPQELVVERAADPAKPPATGRDAKEVKEPKRKPFEELIDMSRGRPGRFPQLIYVLEPHEAKVAAARLQQEVQSVTALVQSASARYGPEAQAAAQRLKQLSLSADLGDRWTAMRADSLFGAINGGMPGNDLSRRYRVLSAEIGAYSRATTELEMRYLQRERSSYDVLSERRKVCSSGAVSGPCQERALAEHHVRMCEATREWTQAWRVPITGLDAAMREYHREQHRVLTALYAHLSDPVLVRAARSRIAMADGTNYLQLLGAASTHVALLAQRAEVCAKPPPEAYELEAYAEAELPGCTPPVAKPKVKVAALEVSLTCEQVEFELATPGWLAGFVNVSYQFSQRAERMKDPRQRQLELQQGRDPDRPMALRAPTPAFEGKLTVTAGGKVSTVVDVAGSGELSAKGGAYVTINGSGELLDVGLKVDTSVSMGVDFGLVGAGVEIGGPGAQVSFVSSG